MPIEITLPAPGGKIGPGFSLQLQSDFVGPLPTGSYFDVVISSSAEGDNPVVHDLIPTDFQYVSYLVASEETSVLSFQQEDVSAGVTVHVIAELHQGGDGVIDSGATTATYDPTGLLWQHINQQPTASGAALTTEQAQQLADDHAAVNPPLLAHDGTAITGAVGDVIVRPSLKFLGIDTAIYTLSGAGTLDVPTVLGVQTGWGLVLDVVEAPPGASYKAGYVVSYHSRVGQFLALWPAAHSDEAMVIEALNLHLAHFTWLFQFAFTKAVAYFIDPMFVVEARFVSAFFP